MNVNNVTTMANDETWSKKKKKKQEEEDILAQEMESLGCGGIYGSGCIALSLMFPSVEAGAAAVCIRRIVWLWFPQKYIIDG